MKTRNHDRELLARLNGEVDSFEQYFEDNADDRTPMTSKKMSLGPSKGNPAFSAQFDVEVQLKYFTVAAGVYTAVAAAAINAALKNKLPLFVLGNSDFHAGFATMKANYPQQGSWVYETPGIYGKDAVSSSYGVFDATAKGVLAQGDLVHVFTSGVLNTVCLVIVRCTQIPYASLLGALSSDRFVMNGIRYTLADPATISQFNNAIGYYNLSLFGKMSKDFVSPNSFKKPENNQANVVDVALKAGVTKENCLGTYVNYDCVAFTWSIFVWSVQKN